MKKAACITSVFLLCLLLVSNLAQEAPKRSKDSDYTLNVNVNLVTLHVSVFDDKDRLIKDLKKDDFSVFEDKVQQEITISSRKMCLCLSAWSLTTAVACGPSASA
jgi:hypothetical protein